MIIMIIYWLNFICLCGCTQYIEDGQVVWGIMMGIKLNKHSCELTCSILLLYGLVFLLSLQCNSVFFSCNEMILLSRYDTVDLF